jgi:LPXTG-motif cell wall-anchored protein
MRTHTAVAVLVLSGLTWIGVPSAAADELPSTPTETSPITAPTEQPAAEPVPGASNVAAPEMTTPEPQEHAAPTEEPVESTGGDGAGPADGVTGEPPEAGDQTAPTGDDVSTVDEGEETGLTESAAPTEPAALTEREERSLGSQASAEPVLDPRASLGDVDCAELTVSITLDNTRSAGAVEFFVVADNDPDTEESYFESSELLAAGAIKVIAISVTDGDHALINVYAFDPSDDNVTVELVLRDMDVQCTGDAPRISIGNVDCNTLTVPVTLDNSRSPTETSFWVVTQWEDQISEETVAVSAGETRVVHVNAVELGYLSVHASNISPGAEGPFANAQMYVRCRPGERLPGATIGEIDCRTRTVSVTIDSSNTEVVIGVEVGAYVPTPDDDEPLWEDYEALHAAPGAIRVVRLGPVPRFIDDVVPVFVVNTEAQASLDDHVIAERLVRIDCPSTANRPIPTVEANGAMLPQTGGFNVALPLLGVALLAGGAGMLALTGRRHTA